MNSSHTLYAGALGLGILLWNYLFKLKRVTLRKVDSFAVKHEERNGTQVWNRVTCF